MVKYPDALILRPPEEDEWILGSGLASERFGGDEILPSGDWTELKCADEDQRKYGYDSNGCANFATIKPYLMLAKLCKYDDFLKDASERYTGCHAGTSRIGTDPHIVAESIRKVAGLVPQEVMPWWEEVDTYEEFYNHKVASSLLPLGKKLLDRYEFGNEWVFPYGNRYTPKEKAELLRKALKRGTVAASVKAWRKDGKYYTKNKGEKDNHWVTVLSLGKRAKIHDQYTPFVKELDVDYDFNAAKVYFLKRKEEKQRSFWSEIWDNFVELWKH